MVLEGTMIVLDNSESSRNGDYEPTRFEAQADAVNLIFNAKTQANPESSVGLMSMAGDAPKVLTTLTTDEGKILNGIHEIKIQGISHFCTAINIAHLALKLRENKLQQQRIIVFNCSQIAETENDIIKLAEKMKKNNISIDVIAFGDTSDDTIRKLKALNDKMKGSDGSHLEIISPGQISLSDSIKATPILAKDGVGGANGIGGAEGGDTQFDLGIGPEQDPDLALALRLSLVEEKRRNQETEKSEKLERIPVADVKKGEASGSTKDLKSAEDRDKKNKHDDGDKTPTA